MNKPYTNKKDEPHGRCRRCNIRTGKVEALTEKEETKLLADYYENAYGLLSRILGSPGV